MIKAIIFDLFETLVTEANSPKITASRISEMLEVPLYEYKNLVSALRNRRYRGEYPDFREVITYIGNTMGKCYDINLINAIAIERETGKAECFNNVSKEIIDMLKELKNLKLKLVLVSNASFEEIKGFNNCEIKSYFDQIIFSCEAGYIKPEIEIYNEACNRIGLRPEECLYIGDGGSDELTGAKNFGMKAYCASWFISQLGYTPPEGFPVLVSPDDILSLIGSQLAIQILCKN